MLNTKSILDHSLANLDKPIISPLAYSVSAPNTAACGSAACSSCNPQSGNRSTKMVSIPLPVDSIPPKEDNEFERLIDQIRLRLGCDKSLSSLDIDHEELMDLFRAYASDEQHWGSFAQHDPTRNYTRNGIENINGNANLLVLVWEPGKGSVIHDHADAHCIVKVLKGSLVEKLYDVPKDNGSRASTASGHSANCSCAKSIMTPKKISTLKTNDVAYISDDIGLHRMMNADDTELAITLHLYTPPYASMYGCSYYEDRNGKKHHVDMSKYYSWRGVMLNEEVQ
ncbi:hypothetical protein BABINDRAFT_159027 [Babjeviella inositovora NRRL Y-12698]|uniref:Cysteine dioxygenase n=1 Tax=Babjeviella inositovora NRRL Y-12698 TaxID=984486 RepID=A0A1E3QZC4_9ASCO|nr:uncharacterized protein BABINDRAFT_159027 [Babjeviella inositovora NRRL Y-12698]ODQ82432.1 hypothetical protein BABINDRAFT_159027 [Babjeviella inositovora NRRL Y-12698]